MCAPIPACWSCGASIVRMPEPLPDFPVPRLLRTNELPSTMEAQASQAYIDGAEEHMRVFLAGLETILTTLDILNRQCDVLEETIHCYKAVFSPFRRLPAELLSEVFVHCLPPDSAPSPYAPPLSSGPALGSAPLLLMSVCKRWRAVALSTPRLWTSFYPQQYKSPPHAVVNQWLARAGALPLSMCVKPRFDIEQFSGIISRYAARWERLSLITHAEIPDFSTAEPFLRLQQLELGTETRTPLGTPKPVTLFRNTPLLRSFRYSGNIPEDLIDLPWSQLTDLTLKGRLVQACVATLLRAPSVESCSLWNMESSRIDAQLPSESMQHLRLKHLRIHDSRLTPSRDWHGFFQQKSLTFPSLLSFAYSGRKFPFLLYHSFQQRSGFKLEKLSLARIKNVQKHEFLWCFAYLPTLVHFELRNHSNEETSEFMSVEVLSRMTRPDVESPSDAPLLLPSLRVIELYDVCITSERREIPDRFASMIRSRRPGRDLAARTTEGAGPGAGVAHLERVSLEFERAITPSVYYEPESTTEYIITTFKGLKDEGLDISLISGTWSPERRRKEV